MTINLIFTEPVVFQLSKLEAQRSSQQQIAQHPGGSLTILKQTLIEMAGTA